jgi:hypothetical protein
MNALNYSCYLSVHRPFPRCLCLHHIFSLLIALCTPFCALSVCFPSRPLIPSRCTCAALCYVCHRWPLVVVLLIFLDGSLFKTGGYVHGETTLGGCESRAICGCHVTAATLALIHPFRGPEPARRSARRGPRSSRCSGGCPQMSSRRQQTFQWGRPQHLRSPQRFALLSRP